MLKQILAVIPLVLFLVPTPGFSTGAHNAYKQDFGDPPGQTTYASLIGALSTATVTPSVPTIDHIGNYTDLADFVSKARSNKKLLLVKTTTVVSTNLAINDNSELWVSKEGLITIHDGVTLTIKGPFKAGLYQVFNCIGSGKVVLTRGKVEAAHPEWWGAVGGSGGVAATNDAAFAACLACGLKQIQLQNTNYYQSATWVFKGLENFKIIGQAGRFGTRFEWHGGAEPQFSIIDCHDMVFINIAADGEKVSTRGFDLQASSLAKYIESIKFSQCSSYNHTTAGWSIGNYSTTSEDRDVHSITLDDCYTQGNVYGIMTDSMCADQIIVRGGNYTHVSKSTYGVKYHFYVLRGALYLYAPQFGGTRSAKDGYVIYTKDGCFKWFGSYGEPGYHVKGGFAYLDTPASAGKKAPQSSLYGVFVRSYYGTPPPAHLIYLNTNAHGLTVSGCGFYREKAADIYIVKSGAKLTSVGNKYCSWSTPWSTPDGDDSLITSVGDETTTNYSTWNQIPTRLRETRFSGGNNGQYVRIMSFTTEKAALSGASVNWKNAIPRGALVIGVTARVTAAIKGATGVNIGIPGKRGFFITGLGVDAGATAGQEKCPNSGNLPYVAIHNGDIVVSAIGSNFTAGAIRITIHVIQAVPPTS